VKWSSWIYGAIASLPPRGTKFLHDSKCSCRGNMRCTNLPKGTEVGPKSAQYRSPLDFRADGGRRRSPKHRIFASKHTSIACKIFSQRRALTVGLTGMTTHPNKRLSEASQASARTCLGDVAGVSYSLMCSGEVCCTHSRPTRNESLSAQVWHMGS